MNRFGRGFGPVVWQITDDDNDDGGTRKFLYPFVRISAWSYRIHNGAKNFC